MIDLFVRVWPQSVFRAKMASAVIERLRLFDGASASVRLIVHPETWDYITPRNLLPAAWQRDGRIIESPADDFARQSRQLAELNAATDIYCLMDDDHLPIGADWVQKGEAAMLSKPHYAMLSSWSINGEVAELTSQDDDVFEYDSCGTPCFVWRFEAFSALPEGEAADYDITLSRHVKEWGRIGFLRDVRHNHLGCEFSQVIPEHWRA